jgi:hypothetical protein
VQVNEWYEARTSLASGFITEKPRGITSRFAAVNSRRLLPTRIQTIFQTAKINKTAFVQEYPRDIVLADVHPSSQAVLCQPPVFSKKVPKSA